MTDPRTDPKPGDVIAGFSPETGKLYAVRVHFLHDGHVHYGKWEPTEGAEEEPESSQSFKISLTGWIEQAAEATIISRGRERVAAA